jgi:hypothetical protein
MALRTKARFFHASLNGGGSVKKTDPSVALVELAKFNPWHLFGCGELADILGVSADLITAVAGDKETPFIGKKARPEWVIEWLKAHPGFIAK